MFVLVKISDVIKISPDLFGLPHEKVLTEEIDRKYANKVVADVGLCITLYDFISIGDAVIHPCHGASHTEVEFRMIAFRPFIGEVIVGKLVRSTPEHIRGKEKLRLICPLWLTLQSQPNSHMISLSRRTIYSLLPFCTFWLIFQPSIHPNIGFVAIRKNNFGYGSIRTAMVRPDRLVD